MHINASLRRAATFPNVRRRASRLSRLNTVGQLALFVALSALTLPYVALRALADDGRTPVDGARYERALFGGLPSIGLQERLYSGHYGALEHAAVFVHMSWFFVPAAVTLLVLFAWRGEFRSYAAWYLGVMYLSVAIFIALPMRPPWDADPHVVRILALRWDAAHIDNNAYAAFPSLHVALPLTLALWAATRRHRLLGGALALYAAAVASAVVFLGEHYVIDVIAAALVAGAVWAIDANAAELARAVRRFATALRERALAPEGGQNLVEFALMFPAVLLFLGVIIVFALMLHTRSNLQQAVREGARQAAVGASLTEVRDLAAGNANDTLDPADVRWCFPDGTGHVGDRVQVYIYKDGGEGYPYDLVATGGTFNALFGAGALTVRMSPKATTRLEHSVPQADVTAAGACP